MKKAVILLLGAVFLLSIAMTASAATVNAINEFEEVGYDEMVGMEIAAFFGDGQSDSGVYAVINSSTGGAFGTDIGGNVNNDWSLTYTGTDTWGPTGWTFTGSNVTSFTVNAVSGGTLFDIVYAGTIYPQGQPPIPMNPENSTDGSAFGYWTPHGYSSTDMSTTGTWGDWQWTFSDPVNLTGEPVVGDMFGFLTMEYVGAGTFDGTIDFGLDTDLVSTVPAPPAVILLGFGLLGLFGIRRKVG